MIGGGNKPLCCDLVAIGLGEMAFLDIYVVYVCFFFSLQEMFYICSIIQESMSGVILMGEFKI